MSSAPNVEYGDPAVAIPNEILRSVVGSGVHGIAIAGTSTNGCWAGASATGCRTGPS